MKNIFDTATESDETCVFGNITVARGQRVEDGCSRVCVCEAGGHLKCQPRCPPNETIAKQHDRCVILSDPRYNPLSTDEISSHGLSRKII